MGKKIAVVPAKAHSSRVPGKNFKSFFDGKSLLEVKVGQLKDSGVFDEIWVSSDSQDAQGLASRLGVSFVPRNIEHTLDATPWSEVVVGILKGIPNCDNEDLIAWSPPTSPLFSNFAGALTQFEKSQSEFDSVFTVNRFNHFLLNGSGLPINFQFGPWHKYSQEIVPLVVVNCALMAAPLEVMLKYSYQIGVRPLMFETTSIEGLDIDTEEEFRMAQLLYEGLGKRS
jgi:N-acylneuraminate cytidylyltransferase